MQSRSSRAKPWLFKSPSVLTPPASTNRAASANDRSQLAADILNEDRVALAARLRDPGDDPPPYYISRESTTADDEPCDPQISFLLLSISSLFFRLNVSRQPLGTKSNPRDSNFDAGHVIGVSEPEEWREISALQTVGFSASLRFRLLLL
jgi:hypothetical protein